MTTRSSIKTLRYLPVLLLFNTVCFAFTGPICSPPTCTVYTITSPTDGVKLTVEDWGASKTRKPAILFLHGYPHDRLLWLNQINSDLRTNYRLITMDSRGFGLSNKPQVSSSYTEQLLADDINAVINTLNLNGVTIVAHSEGGIPLESYIKFYGTAKIRGLVITAGIVDNGVFQYIPAFVFDVISQGAFALTADAFMSANQQFLTLSTYLPLDPGLYNFLLTQDLLAPQDARQAVLGSLGSDNLNSVQNLNVKTLIIWGANDTVIFPGAATYLSGIMANDTVLILNNVAHLPMVENPALYNDALSTFVDSLSH
jgi:non-heme chloroperoxidase